MTTLPIHFKLPGRSYSQIGRKGNVALYSVYSDYLIVPDFALPYVLIGYELIVIKTKNGREIYPSAWQFGKCAWSIPKSIARVCAACARCCVSLAGKLRIRFPISVPDRSPNSQEQSRLAHKSNQVDQTAFKWIANASENATNAPQRRVTLR